MVETSEPFIEETWIGSTVRIGDVELDVITRNERCRVIDQAQNGVASPTRWLKPLGERRDACVAVYARAATPGIVRVGDAVIAGA